jgi:hypothetical protein
VLLRRLSLSALALAAAGMVTVGTVAAQGPGPTPGMGPGMGPEMGMGPGVDLGVGMAPMFVPPAARSGHPMDLGWPVPCPNCRVLVDPCEVLRQCETLPRSMWPEGAGLHPTVTHANVSLYFPGGPLSCATSRRTGTVLCATPPPDAMGWETRTEMHR